VRAAPRIIELDTGEGTADLAVATSKDPHALYVEALEGDLVREAILLLPLEFREIILLRKYEELSYQEIANCWIAPPARSCHAWPERGPSSGHFC